MAQKEKVRAPALGRRQATIMVVDDDREVREVLSELLEGEGYRVRVAENGLRLVSTLMVDRPDLILLDIMMSWIDGYELCRSLKQNESFRDIPVIFMSAKTAPEDIRRGLACGAVDYFTKPMDLDRLLERIAEILQQRDQQRAAATPPRP